MKHLLNLLAAVALLIWGTHLVRTGILRVFGANLRATHLAQREQPVHRRSLGMGVTAVVQSSTATALIVSSFVGQGLVGLPAALAVMLGADVGTSVMAVVFSLDLSWLSPLFIFVGVVLFISRKDTAVGRVGRVLIGLGLMLLALRLITESTTRADPVAHRAHPAGCADQRFAAGNLHGRRAGRAGLFQPGHRAAHGHAGGLRAVFRWMWHWGWW